MAVRIEAWTVNDRHTVVACPLIVVTMDVYRSETEAEVDSDDAEVVLVVVAIDVGVGDSVAVDVVVDDDVVDVVVVEVESGVNVDEDNEDEDENEDAVVDETEVDGEEDENNEDEEADMEFESDRDDEGSDEDGRADEALRLASELTVVVVLEMLSIHEIEYRRVTHSGEIESDGAALALSVSDKLAASETTLSEAESDANMDVPPSAIELKSESVVNAR